MSFPQQKSGVLPYNMTTSLVHDASNKLYVSYFTNEPYLQFDTVNLLANDTNRERGGPERENIITE